MRAKRKWQDFYPFESRYTDIDGHRLHYVDEGNRRAVVMLHGNPTWSFYYRNLASHLRETRRAIVPDHMGCGLSDKPAEYPYNLKKHIDNLEFLLDEALTLDRFDLVVHDWGGAIGMGYAVRHPEKIRRITILNSAAFFLPECPLRIRVCRTPFLGTLAVRGLNAFARAALHMAVSGRRPLSRAVREGYLYPYRSYASRIAVQRFVEDIPLNAGHPTRKTLDGIAGRLGSLAEKPILICWAGEDFCFTENFLQRWLREFPAARVERFPEAGHYLLEDARGKIEPLIADFLNGQTDGNI